MPSALAVVFATAQLFGLAMPALAAGGGGQPQAALNSAAFSGGGLTQNGMVFAKKGQALTLAVSTSNATCVDVSGAFSGHQTGTKDAWAFNFTAPTGDGVQSVTVSASPSTNTQGACTGASASKTATYTLDNTGPVVSAALSPAANAAGWNNSSVTVNWTATDAGVGVAGAQPFKSTSYTANGIFTDGAAGQSDKLGNTGAGGSVTVRVDKAAPSITHTMTANSDGTFTVSFFCDDSQSGGAQSSGIQSCLADGSTTNSKTVGGNTTVSGTATDNAGNVAHDSVTTPQSDSTPPNLSGSPTTQPNSNGWYNNNVTIHWTCSDSGSGIKGSCPADDTISSEGQNLTVSESVSDNAGNTTTATSSPAVSIDKTAPITGISGTSNNWVNSAVTLTLQPSDNLSGVASTTYSVDGGGNQSGTKVSLSADGDHTVTFFSTDEAGNPESPQTVHVKIDQTAPTIGHSFTAPSGYTDGTWTNQNVSVKFTCVDQGGSGVANCGPDATVSTEGASQNVLGIAADNAGNSATDTALVSIDKTDPTIHGSVQQSPNAAGWYNTPVDVLFQCDDALSGVASCTGSKTLTADGGNQSVNGTAADNAGNSASDAVSGINIDTTAPKLDGSFSPGWHTGDVTVHWTCSDAGSGIDGSCPADSTVTGEGTNLGSSASVSDVAGNVTNTTVDGIDIDRTAPVTQASVPNAPSSGWYTGPVQVTLNASDNLSGIASTHYSVDGGNEQVYNGAFSVNGDGQHSVTFYSTDKAGNVEQAGAPISFQIDTTAPNTTVTNPISPASGWYVTSGISFAFNATDSGSGVAKTYYSIDGGTPQLYNGQFTQNLSDGSHKITYWSVDNAGNEEPHETTNTIAVNVDTAAPVTTASGVSNNAWYNGPVQVTLNASDAGSGVASTTYRVDGGAEQPYNAAFTVSSEGQHTVSFYSTDNAGNVEPTNQLSFGIDTTAPNTKASTDSQPNGNGWYNAAVLVTLNPTDAGSGVASTFYSIDGGSDQAYTGAFTVSADGSHMVSFYSKDTVGNVEQAGSITLKIDKTAPVVTLQGGPADGGSYYFGSVPATPSCTATDIGGSGVDNSGCTVSGYDATVGSHTVTGTAKDLAGNTGTAKATYTVNAWTLKGFYQPVDMSGTVNTVKNGSTVPFKFNVYAGTKELTDTSVVTSFKQAPVTCGTFTGDPTDAIEVTTTGGTSLRYDTTAGQFIQNWQTPKKPGTCWTVTLTTKDGTSKSANFQLK